MLSTVTEYISTGLKPFSEFRDNLGLVCCSVGKWNFDIVVVENISVDEKVSVRLVNRHQNYSAVVFLSKRLKIFNSSLIDVHSI